jgi:hypothetical protein
MLTTPVSSRNFRSLIAAASDCVALADNLRTGYSVEDGNAIDVRQLFSPHDGPGIAAEPFHPARPIKHWTDRLYLSAVLGRQCDYQLNPMERVGLLRSRG